MAKMVSSVVIQESFSQIISGLVQKYEQKEETNAIRHIERLEMAHIRLEAALETSEKWQITDASLLHRRKKLKRAAQDCGDTLHKGKQRILEEEKMEQEVMNSSFPKRIAHATKSFVSSVFNHDNKDLSRSVIKRFEWYADGTSEFLRFIELGGTPYSHIMPFGSLIKNLFAGKELHHKIVQGNNPSLQLWLTPFRTAKHGTEAAMGNIYFSMIVQLSESTDIVGIAVKSLQLFTPHVKSTVENITKELTQLPTQDLSWMPFVYSYQKEHWGNLHRFATQWFRPNPLCCKQHDRHYAKPFSNQDMAGISDASLEPLIEFNFQWQVSRTVYRKHKASLSGGIMSLQDSPYLKAGITFSPHSSVYMIPENKSSEAREIVGGGQHLLHTDITCMQQLGRIMLPKAIHYFSQNAEATVYQLVERPRTLRTSSRTWRTIREPIKRKLFQGQEKRFGAGHI
ncbi:hypothetical protein BDA96_02G100900 [Sorghum bicolor]|uniref:Uncharacterized protein n=2 Tax=Sorghum bicolor TaxID=4558 RepID=A0A921RMH5_SORBI|nr:hypothetical protein BDA96_02G100900 [Sorghum bicolor]OQU88797.1 hypothetical protein SORBI_3002G097700 [Sorghum bicolor]